MESGIRAPELQSIEKLFAGDAHYVVPKYQRSFAWGSDEIEELWEDILATIERGGDYFLGTIVIHDKEPGNLEIIDGQQRLACISMIFSAIRHVYMTKNDERAVQLFKDFLGSKGYESNAVATPKLVLNEINNPIYVDNIIAGQSIESIDKSLKNKGMHKSNKLLLQAYKYFLKNIASETITKGTEYDTFIVPLINSLRTSIKLIKIPVASEEDANLFFESLNARGKELAVSDLVKNRLYLEAKDQVTYMQQLWEQMSGDLGRRPIPEFLRHYWIAKKVGTQGILVREKQLYKLVAQSVNNNQSETIKLLADLASSAIDYSRIDDYSLWPDDNAYGTEFEEILKDLQLFRVTQCNPVLLNAIQNLKSAKEIVGTFRIVSNFSFRYFIVGNQSPGSLERNSNAIAFDIRIGKHSSSSDIATAFRSINSDVNFRSDFSLLTLPKSRAKIARYILYKINNFQAKQASKSGGEQIANPDEKDVTLEHILPQNSGENWRAEFSKGVDVADYLYRLGNMTLLRAKVNNEAANVSFADKQQIAFNDSSLAINQYLKEIQKWGDKEIDQRQEKMAKMAIEIWKL